MKIGRLRINRWSNEDVSVSLDDVMGAEAFSGLYSRRQQSRGRRPTQDEVEVPYNVLRLSGQKPKNRIVPRRGDIVKKPDITGVDRHKLGLRMSCEIWIFDIVIAGVIAHDDMIAEEDMDAATSIVENDIVFDERQSVISRIIGIALTMPRIVENDSISVSRLAVGIADFVVHDPVHVVIDQVSANDIVDTLCMIEVCRLID